MDCLDLTAWFNQSLQRTLKHHQKLFSSYHEVFRAENYPQIFKNSFQMTPQSA